MFGIGGIVGMVYFSIGFMVVKMMLCVRMFVGMFDEVFKAGKRGDIIGVLEAAEAV